MYMVGSMLFMYVNLDNFQNTNIIKYYYYPHFISEETVKLRN